MATLEQIKKGIESYWNTLDEDAKKAGTAAELYCLSLANHLESRFHELIDNSSEKPSDESEDDSLKLTPIENDDENGNAEGGK